MTQLCREFGGVTICRKGQEDILADGKDGKKFGFYVNIETCEHSVFVSESGMKSPQTLPPAFGRVTERAANPVKIRLKSVESMS